MAETSLELVFARRLRMTCNLFMLEPDLNHVRGRNDHVPEPGINEDECRFASALGKIELEPEILRLPPQLLDRRLGVGRKVIYADESVGGANEAFEPRHVGRDGSP